MNSLADDQPTQGASARTVALRVTGRLGFTYFALLLAFHFLGSLYGTAILPVLKAGLGLAHPQYVVQSGSVANGQVRIVASIQRRPRDSRRAATASAPITAVLPLSTLFICPLVVFTLLVGWPYKHRPNKLMTLAIAVPLIGLVAALDSPNVIAATLAERAAAPNGAPRDILAFWRFFLESGGRQFLGILTAWIAATGAGRWRRPLANAEPDLAPGAGKQQAEVPKPLPDDAGPGAVLPKRGSGLPLILGSSQMRLYPTSPPVWKRRGITGHLPTNWSHLPAATRIVRVDAPNALLANAFLGQAPSSLAWHRAKAFHVTRLDTSVRQDRLRR